MTQLNDYQPATTDWRASLRSNNRKTMVVITLFFLIYLGLGLLVDTFVVSSEYPDVPLSACFEALITFKIIPLATIVMLIVAGISLLVTFSMYDKLMLLGTEYHEITPSTAKNQQELQLYNTIEEMKIAAGLRYMPKVFIIDADYMNAFASGYSEKSAMVAITRGLLNKLNRSELQAVMAHELSHIRHLDIKLTLMASLLANITLIVLDIFFYHAIYSRNSNNKRNGLVVAIMIIRYLLPVINVLMLLYLSRTREYMADAGAVELLRDNQPLASALIKIQNDYSDNQETYSKSFRDTPHENIRRNAYIFDPTQAGIKGVTSDSIMDFFSTHPNLRDRLAAIGFKFKGNP